MNRSQVEILRSYEQALKRYIIEAHEDDNIEWVKSSEIFALTKERRRVKDVLSIWKEKERVREFNER